MIRNVIYIVVFSFIVNSNQNNNTKNRCRGGILHLDNLHSPCDCTGLSRTGKFCDDPLRPGLILVPGGRNPNFDLENERRHAKVIPKTMDRILYNRTTDTMIGIFDTLVYSVYFDKATVDEICSIPTDTCDITEGEILNKIHDKIECKLHKDERTVYGTCSVPNNRNANEEQTFMKRLNRQDTIKYWNLQIWEERCSILPNTRNYTGKRLIGCTPAVIVNSNQNNNTKNRCRGGILHFDNLHSPCDCTGLSRTGRFCDDTLRPGLILVPGCKKPNTALENERRHAKVMPRTMDRILYNRTTDTMIGIFDTLVYSVYFDKATVDEICSIPTDTCNITEDEILNKIHDKIDCKLHKDQHTVYGTCSAPNNLIANEEQTFIKRLNREDTIKYWNLQIWEERCSIPLNTRNYTGKRLIGCTPAVIGSLPSNAWRLSIGICIPYLFGSVCGLIVFLIVKYKKSNNRRPMQAQNEEIPLNPQSSDS